MTLAAGHGEALPVVETGADPFEPDADGRAVVLYRPVGPNELRLIVRERKTGYPAPPASQPVFAPVLHAEDAVRIARDWTTLDAGSGYVTRVVVRGDVARAYPVRRTGSPTQLELHVPAGELARFNAAIVGVVDVVQSFGAIPADLAPHVPPPSNHDG